MREETELKAEERLETMRGRKSHLQVVREVNEREINRMIVVDLLVLHF